MREQVKFWRAQDCGNLELLHATYITHSFSRHNHEGFAIGVIEGGVEAFNYRGALHLAPSGSIVVINPGEVHTGHAAGEVGWTYRMLYPNAALLELAASEIAGCRRDIPYFQDPIIQDEHLAWLFLSLHRALENPVSTLERESRLVWTLTQLIARHADSRPVLQSVGREDQTVRRVREYLEAHYSENVSLKQLSHMVNLRTLRLLRVFRKAVGMPPHAYLTQVRICRAKTLLSLGWPILQVALETGFTDQSHLTRHFKRLIGVTPGQYALGCKNVQDR